MGAYDQRVYALNGATGKTEWMTDPASITLGPVRAPVAVLGSRVYVPTLTAGLVALNDKGSAVEEAWRAPFTRSLSGSVAVVRSSGMASATVYAANLFGELFAIEDKNSPSVAWSVTGLGRIEGGVSFAHNLVFVGSEDQHLRAFSASTGDLAYEVSLPGSLSSLPVIEKGTAYVLDATGRLTAFGNAVKVPERLVAVSSSATTITLSWEPVLVEPGMTPVSGYAVYRSPSGDEGLAAIGWVHGAAGASLYVDTGLTESGRYYYAVTAMHNADFLPDLEESTYSDSASATVFFVPQPLGAPVAYALAATAGDGVVQRRWSVAAGARPVSAMRIYRQVSGGALVFLRSVVAPATAFEDLRVENRKLYGYAVAAMDDLGATGPLTPIVSATPLTVDWPMFQRDVLHEARDEFLSIPPPLGEHWRYRLIGPGGASFSGYQTGITVGGTVFVYSEAGEVRAYHVESGATLWAQTGYPGGSGSPAVHRGRVYVAHLAGLVAFDAASGAVIWSMPGTVPGLLGPNDVGKGQESSPVIYQGILFVGMIRNNQFQLVAVDIDPASPTYRTVLWGRQFGFTFVKASPGAANGLVYFVSGDGILRAMNPFTGTVIWQSFLGAYVTTTESINLSVMPQVVLVAHENGYLYAYDAITGAFKWNTYVGSRFTSPAVAGATVFVGSFNANTVYAVNAKTGAYAWIGTTFTTTGIGLSNGGPIVADGRVHVASSNGQVFSLDIATGAKLDTFTLPGVSPNGHMSAGEGHLFISNFDGTIMAVRPVPATPLHLTALGRVDEVALMWEAPAIGVAVSTYRIFRSSVAGGAESLAGSVSGGVTVFLDHSMPRRVNLSYRVIPVDVRGVEGRSAGPVTVRAYYPPNLQAAITSPLPGAIMCLNLFPTVLVTGTASSGNFVSATLAVDTGSGFVPVSVVGAPVLAGGLGFVAIGVPGPRFIRLTVGDETGLSATATVAFDVPAESITAGIAWPANSQIIPVDCAAGPVTLTITGRATATVFASYRVETSLLSSSLVILSSYSSTSPVGPDGDLAPVTMVSCTHYVVTLTVEDVCGRVRRTAITLFLQGPDEFVASITSFSTRGKDPDQHRSPVDVAVDAEEFVWIADFGNRRVQKYTATGQFLFEIAGPGGNGPLSQPVALAPEPGGGMVVLNRGSGTIDRLTRDGVVTGSTSLPPQGHLSLLGPEGVSIGPNGDLLVADTLHDRLVQIGWSGDHAFPFVAPAQGGAELRRPSGVTFDPGLGLVVVADTGHDRLAIFDPVGIYLGAIGSHGILPGQFDRPYEAAIGPDRSGFVSETGNNRVTWLIPAGGVGRVLVIPPAGVAAGFFDAPHGLALVADGSILFVADTGHDRIVSIRLRPTADGLDPIAVIASPAASATVFGMVGVSGIAADAWFQSYTLEVGGGAAPLAYSVLTSSTTPVWGGLLGAWDTTGLPLGPYTLRLTVVDRSGRMSVATRTVILGSATVAQQF